MISDKQRPSEVRQLIIAQHEELRVIYTEVELLLRLVQAGEPDGERRLREHCRMLYQVLLRHIAVEDRLLAPALRQADGFGPLRAEELLAEHDRQRRLLRYALSSVDVRAAGGTLVQSIPPLLDSLREDMAHEERDLLNPDLLKDDVIDVDVCTG